MLTGVVSSFNPTSLQAFLGSSYNFNKDAFITSIGFEIGVVDAQPQVQELVKQTGQTSKSVTIKQKSTSEKSEPTYTSIPEPVEEPQAPTSEPQVNSNILQEQTSSGIITADAGVAKSVFNTVCNLYSSSPQAVRSWMENNGWQIKIPNVNLGELEGYGKDGLAGLTSYSRKTVFLSKDHENHMDLYLKHELGHVFDYSLGRVSDSEEFQNIYNLEVATFNSCFLNYEPQTYTSAEYFAEAYCFYILGETDTLRNNCPQTYEFLAQYM